MNKTIIANRGIANQGKSHTVKNVARLLLEEFVEASVEPEMIDYSGDIKVIITIGEIKIGIESQGDPYSRLQSSLIEFGDLGCEIIICSTRSAGSTVHATQSLNGTHGYDIIWSTNYRSTELNTDSLNIISAIEIVNLIHLLLKNEI